MGQVVGKEACPSCRASGGDRSGDNLIRYEDGSTYCFACGHSERGTESSSVTVTPPKASGKLLTDLEYRPLVKRKLTEETCKHFKYAIGEHKGRRCHVAPYYDEEGRVIAQKLRFADKSFQILKAKPKVTLPLFGQHLWRDGGKQVVVTEGEIDALSMSQIQNLKWAVVSVPNGAQGAAKTIGEQIEWLEKFEKVIFMFDMDEVGQKAARECAALISVGKAYIASLPCKDANECLLQGMGKELIDAMWSAKSYRPDGVIDIASVVDKACAEVEQGRPWAWASLTEKTHGRRRGELYGFGGGTGCGKSTVFKQLMTFINETEGLPIGGIFLEEPVALTAKTLAGMKMRKRVHVPNVEYDRAELRRTLESMEGKIFLYDHFGSMDWETIKQRIRYMVRGCGIQDIFLDHLTALAAAVEDDERKAIDKIMAELSSLAQELDCTIYFISHLTTPSTGKPHEEGGRVFENQFRGSRSIAYWSHFLFGIERDKQSNDPTVFRVLKDRYTGDAAGLTFGLRYDMDTGLMSECELPTKSSKSSGFVPEEDGEY